MTKVFKLAILNSHPIQYFAPLYRRLAQEPRLDLTVYFCSHQGVETYFDPGFGKAVQWDTPLLEGYHHCFLPNPRHQDRVGGFFSLINPALVSELHRQRYDALWVHGHNYLSSLMGILAAKVLGTAVLMRAETHLLLRRASVKRALRRPVMRFFYRHVVDRCLPIGTRNREFYLAHNVKAAHLFDVPYVVDNAYFMEQAAPFKAQVKQTREALGLPVDKPLLLFASKLMPRKRPQDLLQAYHKLRAEGMDAALLYVGSGELEAALKQYVTAHHVPDVYFFGFRNQSELPKVYAVSDVFVLPSENEPWGLVINEVMCAGLPVVASAEIGAVPDLVIDGETGFTFPSGDIERLSQHLKTLVADPALRRQMGENAYNRISAWGFEQCVQGVMAALESLNIPERNPM